MSSEKVILKSSEDVKFETEEAVVVSSEKKKMIILKSSDDEKFEIEEAVALQSETLEHLIEDGCADDFIPLPNVNSKILRMVIDYCNKHHENSNPNNEKLKKWDAEFVKVDQPTLFELILAANYLTIKGLLDLTCQTVANMVKGKTTEEMRQLFGIKNDFTPEEEEELKRENQWAFN